MDPRLGSNYNKEQVMVMINAALLCTNDSATVRPTMSSVVSMLEGNVVVPAFLPGLVQDPSVSNNEMKRQCGSIFNKVKNIIYMHESQIEIVSSTSIQSMSMDVPHA